MYSIPTLYKSILFRSRLEATWAAFFDNLGWQWDYEPVDFNGWIPDFAIFGAKVTYIEVKPVIEFPTEVAQKMVKSGCKSEMMIVGLNPNQEPKSWSETNRLGWFVGNPFCNDEPCDETDEIVDYDGFYDEAVFAVCHNCSTLGFIASDGWYGNRICGEYDGDHYVLFPEYLCKTIMEHWAVAKNKTQWRKHATCKD